MFLTKRKGFISIIVLVCSTFFALSDLISAETEIASINLELSEDTLALAEPTLLTVEIRNLFKENLFLRNTYFFGLEESNYLSLYLITPDNEIWRYAGMRGRVNILYSVNAELYLSLPPAKTVSRNMMTWWTGWVPTELQAGLENLSPGRYQIFATYPFTSTHGRVMDTVYSDTISFLFLPLENRYKPALLELDSIADFFSLIACESLGRKALQRIRGMKTPYSEAADALLITWIKDYDSLTSEKSRFDNLYPFSVFSPILLKYQYKSAIRSDLFLEADSLLGIWEIEVPTYVDILIEQEKIDILTTKERRER